MTTDKFTVVYQGDPKLFLGKNGSYLKFISGQPVMDSGLENAVLISLFTREGWAGNHLLRNRKYRIGSRFEAALDEPIILQTLNNARDEAAKALEWMIEGGLVGSIDISVTNPVGSQVVTSIQIHPPNMPIQNLLLVKNGVNWVFQIGNPAYQRGE